MGKSIGLVIAGIIVFALIVGAVYGVWVLIAWLIVETFGLSYSIWMLGGCGLVVTAVLKGIFKNR